MGNFYPFAEVFKDLSAKNKSTAQTNAKNVTASKNNANNAASGANNSNAKNTNDESSTKNNVTGGTINNNNSSNNSTNYSQPVDQMEVDEKGARLLLVQSSGLIYLTSNQLLSHKWSAVRGVQ